MGRAYTEKERKEIRVKMMEAGIEIFHGDDAKAMIYVKWQNAPGYLREGSTAFIRIKSLSCLT